MAPEAISPDKNRTLIGEIRHNTERAAGLGVPPRMYATEIGYPTHEGPWASTETEQARYSVLTPALLSSLPEVAGVYWYDFREDGTVRDLNEHHFGVVRHQAFTCSPKPAAVAMSVFARLTAGAVCLPALQDGDVHRVVFKRPDGTELMLAWCTAGSARPATLTGRVTRVLDLMGNPLAAEGGCELTGDVLYVEGTELGIGN